jgi:acetyltransferase-like isoleucine patch superfamily enzyme
MSALEDLLELTRKGTPLGRKLRSAAVGFSQFSLPAGRLHRLLLSERALRRQLSDELARALYWQPMFASLCERTDGPFRMELCPDSRMPAVVNCRISLGRGVRFSARTTFSGARNAPEPPRIRIGEGTYVGHRVVLRAGLGLDIGRHCFFASNVFLSSDPGHPLDAARRRTEAAPVEDLGTIEIGDDVWIAEGAAVIGSTIRIGDGAVVAARSVVTKDVPPRTLVAGAPARVVRSLSDDEDRRGAAVG